LSRVSVRYARALFSLADEEKKLEAIAVDMGELKKLVEGDTDFGDFILNPLLSSSKQADVIRELFTGKVDPITFDFLQLLCKKKRLNQLSEIVDAYNGLMLKKRNQVHAEVTSAVALDDQQMDAIKANLESMTDKSVILNTKKDSALIGGFKVLIDGVIIDNSVQYQLFKLKEKLVS
jgi:F-type H+-transporting ATPase subunit delta